jgi:hypothetical protein
MKPHISSLDCDWERLRAVHWAEFECVIVQSAAAIEIADPRRAAISPAEYPAGVAFGPDSELRWQRLSSGAYRLVCIHDGGKPLPGSEFDEPLTSVEAEPKQVLLWGERDEAGFFYEGRIPRLLRYPGVPPPVGGRTALSLRHYVRKAEAPEITGKGVDRTQRDTALFRFVGLEPAGVEP